VLANCLTPPTLLEMAIYRQLPYCFRFGDYTSNYKHHSVNFRQRSLIR
jgi:hypothetical protein